MFGQEAQKTRGGLPVRPIKMFKKCFGKLRSEVQKLNLNNGSLVEEEGLKN